MSTARLLVYRLSLIRPRSRLQHLHAFNVDLVAVDVSSYSDVMSVVLLESIGIVDGEHLLIFVSDDDGTGAGCDAFFGAGFRFLVGSLDSTLGVADPAIHGLGIAGKRHRGDRHE